MKFAQAIVIFGFVLLASCKQKATVKQKEVANYQVLIVTPHKVTSYWDHPATIQGQNIVEIRPMVTGYLEAIYVNEGTTVSKGELLFRIKNPQYEQDIVTAKAAIKIAEANVNTARMNVEKVKPLVENDIVSKYELEAAKYTLQSEQAALAQANATLANAQTNQGYTYIKSPQDGTIGLIPYKVGALISSTNTNPLTTLSNTTNVYAYFSLNEKQLMSMMQRVNGNTMAEKLSHIPPATLVLANGTLYTGKGKVETAGGAIESSTGTATFKATFANPAGIIQSGASATIRIPRVDDAALLVPQTAIYQLQDKSFVYKLIEGNKVLSTIVTTSSTDDGNFTVITSGVKAGDKILLNGLNLQDSTVVKPTPVNQDSLFNHMDTTNKQ
ncbi:MAG: efflux RND transporter periplasmic adaptor subunit [Bacteroidota bacterium]